MKRVFELESIRQCISVLLVLFSNILIYYDVNIINKK